jgi:lipopolysaccharide export system protein LptA
VRRIRLGPALPAVVALALLATPLEAQQAAVQQSPFTGFFDDDAGPIDVGGDQFEQTTNADGSHTQTFTGNVSLVRGATTLHADQLTLYNAIVATGPGQPGTEQLQRIEATGHVNVVSADQTATGDQAVMDLAAGTIVMTGNVVLTQGDNRATASRMNVDMATGVVTLATAHIQITPPPRAAGQ